MPGIELPKIPTRTVVLALGGLCAVGLLVFGGKAIWGDSLLVRTNVPGATVLIDGEEKGHMPADGATPLSVGHLHGKFHSVVVKAAGYRDGNADVTFPNRMAGPLMVYLAPKPAGIHLHALPGSSVFLNGQFGGRTDGGGDWSAPNLQPAEYRVAVRQQGYVDWTNSVSLKPGDDQNLSATQAEVPLTPEQKQEKAMALLNKADQEFQAGQLTTALADCQASADQGAGQSATDLCGRIQATIAITGGAK